MNKFFDNVCDIAVVVGASVGVGLISGKETQVFVGTLPNAVIFAVVFCVILCVFREYCRKNAATDTSELAVACFGRFHVCFNYALTACAFVCVVTCLAGVERCLSDILYLSNLPLYAVLVATLSALVLARGMSALKICNVVSLIMAFGLFAALAFCNVPSNVIVSPSPFMPAIYALFSFTMSIALLCRLGVKTSKRGNIVRSILSSVIVAALIIVTTLLADFSQPLPTLSGIENPFLKLYAVVTIALCSMCGIAGCALPVCETVNGLVNDKTLASTLVFGFACAFSMFGFDFLVRIGYVFVALIGAVTLIATLIRRKSEQPRSKCKAVEVNA